MGALPVATKEEEMIVKRERREIHRLRGFSARNTLMTYSDESLYLFGFFRLNSSERLGTIAINRVEGSQDKIDCVSEYLGNKSDEYINSMGLIRKESKGYLFIHTKEQIN